jgi:putative tryptophan/tyrosine transport system substrate-binding protein
MQSARFGRREAWLADIARKNGMPTMFGSGNGQFAECGGLMNFGASIAESWRNSAAYVDKILKGAKPADLPVEQPTHFPLIINHSTAESLGLNLPQKVLLQADKVIREPRSSACKEENGR